MVGETTQTPKGGETLVDVRIGQMVYDADGAELGHVRGLDDAGFYVRSGAGTERLTLERARDVFGKDYVMWRCWECGEMGRIERDLPETCPSCGAGREDIYYWAED